MQLPSARYKPRGWSSARHAYSFDGLSARPIAIYILQCILCSRLVLSFTTLRCLLPQPFPVELVNTSTRASCPLSTAKCVWKKS